MAQLKNTTISDTGFLQLPVGTTTQRASTQNGQLRYNSELARIENYNATSQQWRNLLNRELPTVATGGIIEDVLINGIYYRLHKFTSTGTASFQLTKSISAEYLIVAGGGGGGADHGGGGGAGGLLQGSLSLSAQTYNIEVGSGGTGAPSVRNSTEQERGNDGGLSSAFGLTAVGGGGGGGGNSVTFGAGRSGGSAGGNGRGNTGSGTLGTVGQGNAGGGFGDNNSQYQGAGGGGAGGPGLNALAGNNTNTNGGVGALSNITGVPTFYAGGGGGNSTYSSAINNFGQGGTGGGGSGASNFSPARSGIPNTGGGGGGANRYAAGGTHLQTSIGSAGSGGSGIVIIRYQIGTM